MQRLPFVFDQHWSSPTPPNQTSATTANHYHSYPPVDATSNGGGGPQALGGHEHSPLSRRSAGTMVASHFSSAGPTPAPPAGANGYHKSSVDGKASSRTRQEYLKEIRESLQPFQNESYANGGGGGFCDTLSSEGSSGTTGSDVSEMESSMLNQLVGLGYHKESAWYALKLTQFRNVVCAAELLNKLPANNGVLQDGGHLLPDGINDGESGSSRSESPLTRVSSPLTSTASAAAAWSHLPPHAGSQQHRQSSASSTSSYRSTQCLATASLSPAPSIPASHGNLLAASDTNGSSNRLWPKRTPADSNGADFSLQPAPAPSFQGAAHSTRVAKPVAQSAVAPTVISIGPSTSKTAMLRQSQVSAGASRGLPPTKVLAAHFEPNQPPQMVKIEVNQSERNYRLESRNGRGDVVSVQVRSSEGSGDDVRLPPAGVQRVFVGGGNGSDIHLGNGSAGGRRKIALRGGGDTQQYIEQLCQRADGLLLTNPPTSVVVPGANNNNVASVTDTNGGPSERQTRWFSDILSQGRHRQSPMSSSVSTDSSTESRAGGGGSRHALAAPDTQLQHIHRTESPLPASVFNSRNMTTRVQPCAPKAFRFFMEQHIENVIKHHRERVGRRMQLEKEMSVAQMGEREKEMMRQFLSQKESHHLRLKRQRLNRSMFDRITTLGVGAFGEVNLVRKKAVEANEGQLYAMKTLRKTDVIKLNQAAHVKAERDILSEADSEWIVKLYYSFQDQHCLYFVMEYIPGGDMMALLIKKEIFDEQLARFYIAELICAIEYVHGLGFIHRDIKPDNILIDGSGHIKLTDFGLCTGLRWTHDKKYYEPTTTVAHAHQDSMDLLSSELSGTGGSAPKVLHRRRQNKREKTHSLVGTTNYMAPEVLLREGHTQLCDWWSVGVILYEMVVGRPPFHADSPRDTQSMVIQFKEYLKFPSVLPYGGTLSACAKDLIQRLCSHQSVRLGSKNGAAEIKQHSFFKGTDFATIRLVAAPYVPPIAFPTDTSNFEPVEGGGHKTLTPSDAGADDSRSSTLKKANGGDAKTPGGGGAAGGANGSNPAFYEFTFRHFFQLDGHGCPTVRRAGQHAGTPRQHTRPPLAPVFERPPAAASTDARHQPSMHV